MLSIKSMHALALDTDYYIRLSENSIHFDSISVLLIGVVKVQNAQA